MLISNIKINSNGTASLLAALYLADPGLGGPPSVETSIILGLGVLVGSVVMGITGFGTAILHLTIWSIAGALGFDSGSLKLAVITCGIGMTMSMIPMFFLAKATKYAIKPLAISVPIGKALSAPLGAVVLKFLPARHIEAMVSVLMVLIITILNRATLKDWTKAAGRWLEPSQSAYTGHRPSRQEKGARLPRGTTLSSSASSLSRLYQDTDELHLPLLHNVDSDAQLLQQPDPDQPLLDAEGDSGTSSCSSDEQDEHHFFHHETPVADGVILIQVDDSTVASPLQPPSPSAATSQEPDAVSSSSSAAGDSLVHEEATVLKHGFWGLFAIGMVTGLATGFLTGATGIGGPPMMVMYVYLDVSKAAVRGTNSIMSLVQDQIIGYIVFGLIRWEDRFAYLAGASAGLAGCIIGHSVQKLMDQKQFSRVMTGLLGLCFCLMTAAAAGWINVS